MAFYNNDILIKNIRKLMDDNSITQQQLADILCMSQSNVSKALNENDKKNFTLDQVVGIAKYFKISLDKLIGNSQELGKTISPRSIGEYFVRLIESGDIQFFKHSVEEEIFEPYFDERELTLECNQTKCSVEYDAFYFPSYWYLPSDLSYEQEAQLYSEMTQCGNETKHYNTNKFLHQFLQIHAIYKQNGLEEDTYRTVVNDLLAHLHD